MQADKALCVRLFITKNNAFALLRFKCWLSKFQRVFLLTLLPCPAWHQPSFLVGKCGVFNLGVSVLLALWAVVQPRVLTSCLRCDCSKCAACKQFAVSKPCVLFTSGTETSAFKSVTKCIMHRTEQIVGKHRAFLFTVRATDRPFQAHVFQQRICRRIKISCSKTFICRKHTHSFIFTDVAHCIPRRGQILCVVRNVVVCKPEFIAVLNQRIVLCAGLTDQVLISLFDLWILRSMRHLVVCISNTTGAVFIYLDIFFLSAVVYSVVFCVLFCD